MLDEIPQGGTRLVARHRIIEGIEPAWAVGKAPFHHVNDRPRHVVTAERPRCLDQRGTVGAKTLAIVPIEVPLATGRIVGGHENAVASSHLPVEGLQQQRLTSIGVRLELIWIAQEMAVDADFQVATH